MLTEVNEQTKEKKMSLLSQVTSGKLKKPHFITIYGPEGCGKSTFASEAPNPIFACTEDGTNSLDVIRLPKITSFQMIMDSIQELMTSKHNYKTLVVDSLDHLEPLIHEKVCKDGGMKSIEDFGFGKGQVLATKEWQQFFSALKDLREKMNVILICHSQVKLFNDPSSQGYDRYEIKLHKSANALVKENCEAVLFATYENFINVDKNTKKGKGLGGESRVIYTEYRAYHDAKNRFGLPYKIDLSYKAFDDAVASSNPESIEVLNSTIEGLLTKVTDENLRSKAAEQFATAKSAADTKKLVAIKNRLLQVTGE